jgi:RND family efflux transporter MFP subunit
MREADLATVTLTLQAESRLDIPRGLTTFERRKVPRRRTVGGEVVVVPGRALWVPAPFPGALAAPGSFAGQRRAALLPGARVRRGQPVFLLRPILPPERAVPTPAERLQLREARAGLRLQLAQARAALGSSLAEAEGAVARARVEVEAGTTAFRRAERLLQKEAGSARALDEAKAQLEGARASLRAAEARRDLLAQTKLELQGALDRQAPALAPLPITSPQDGVLREVRAAAGQVVSAGAPLFEVIADDPVWVRVPIYAGDLGNMDLGGEAQVGSLSERPGKPLLRGKPLQPAPPVADPVAATVDLYYEVENRERALRPGVRLAVSLPLKGDETAPVVPWSAVLHDVQGGAWVYEAVAPRTYVRRRVHLQRVHGGLAVLTDGAGPLKLGARVVTSGAAELFGAELGP